MYMYMSLSLSLSLSLSISLSLSLSLYIYILYSDGTDRVTPWHHFQLRLIISFIHFATSGPSLNSSDGSQPCEERYAYVCSLWGGKHSAQYVLGALVLAWSLRKTGTPHDLVILVTFLDPTWPHGGTKER